MSRRKRILAAAAMASIALAGVGAGQSRSLEPASTQPECDNTSIFSLWELDVEHPFASRRRVAGAAQRRWLLHDVSPDGSSVVYTSGLGGQSRLGVVGIDGRHPRTLASPPGGGLLLHARWSPDGRRIAFVSTYGSQVWVVDRGGHGLKQVGTGEVAPSWSPDSRSLALVGFVGGRLRLVVVGVDGGRRLAVAPASPHAPAWSPRGGWIAYEGPDGSTLRLIRTNGAGDHRVGTGTNPSWAPDGRLFVFNRSYGVVPPPNADALVIADVWGRVHASFEDGVGRSAVWSPLGGTIAYGSTPHDSDTTRMQVFSVDRSGRDRRQLTRDRRTGGGSDEIQRIVWARSGHDRGRRIFYLRDLCPT